MNEIKCPNCGQVFKVDESGFENIVKQVRDHEFEKELHERELLLKQDKENAVKLAEVNTKADLQGEAAKKDTEIAELKAQYEKEGKAQLVIAAGCTGGMHRSVFIANHIYQLLKEKGCIVKLEHRDLMKNEVWEHVREEV